MKVLNVIISLDPISGGGSVERTFQMSRFLAQKGAECTILTTDLGLTAERINALKNIKVVALPCFNKRFYLASFSYSKIRDLISRVDIIHLMNHWTFQNALVYLLARRLRKPYVICAAGALTVYGRSRILKIIYNLVIGKKIIRNANFCIAITLDEVENFKSYGINPKKIVIIPNGITGDNLIIKEDVYFRNKFNLSSKHIILFAGRLNYIKGPDLLLQAFCNLKNALYDYQLVFIGSDEGMLAVLKKIADENGIKDQVSFLGYLGGKDKLNAYNASRLVVIPSRKEAMSIVVLEAGVAGKPVLITDQCGFNCVANTNGGKVVTASVEGLQQGLKDLLEDADKLKLLGNNLMKLIKENFLWDSLIDEYIKLYERILCNNYQAGKLK
jgi:glycosyltransferase involved in cell wall biosynthesis